MEWNKYLTKEVRVQPRKILRETLKNDMNYKDFTEDKAIDKNDQ